MDERRPERIKTTVIAFHDMTFNQCRPAEALEELAEHLLLSRKG